MHLSRSLWSLHLGVMTYFYWLWSYLLSSRSTFLYNSLDIFGRCRSHRRNWRHLIFGLLYLPWILNQRHLTDRRFRFCICRLSLWRLSSVQTSISKTCHLTLSLRSRSTMHSCPALGRSCIFQSSWKRIGAWREHSTLRHKLFDILAWWWASKKRLREKLWYLTALYEWMHANLI